jgi:hypothetical protein
MSLPLVKLPLDCVYFPIEKCWQELSPIFESETIRELTRYEMNSFLVARWEVKGKTDDLILHKTFKYPVEFDEADWARTHQYHAWVCSASCHFMCNVNLAVLKIYQPEKDWKLIFSRKHSTIWDGDHLIYDMQSLALGFTACQVVNTINNHNAVELPVGRIPFHKRELEPDIMAVTSYID